MKLKLIIEAEYELPPAEARPDIYGTSDPYECARIDEQNDPMDLLVAIDGPIRHRVVVVDGGPETDRSRVQIGDKK